MVFLTLSLFVIILRNAVAGPDSLYKQVVVLLTAYKTAKIWQKKEIPACFFALL